MLVYKRRVGQGVIFDGLLRITVQELNPEVWLSVESQALPYAPTIFARASRTDDSVIVGVRSPKSYLEEKNLSKIKIGPETNNESQITLVKAPGETVDIDGLVLEIGRLEGGEHHGRALLHVHAPHINEPIQLAVLTKYSYAVDVATSAAQSVRIYRTEVWAPAAESNEEAAQWTSEKMQSLQRRAPKTA